MLLTSANKIIETVNELPPHLPAAGRPAVKDGLASEEKSAHVDVGGGAPMYGGGPGLQRNHGCQLLMQQFWAMLVKKVLYTKRNLGITVTQVREKFPFSFELNHIEDENGQPVYFLR